MSEAPTIDWEQAYARLDRVRRSLEAGEELSPEERRRVLEQRAEALAEPPKETPMLGETIDLLVFSIADERYGMEVEHVLDVAPLGDLAGLPGTPAFVRGIVNHRGRALPVLDLRHLLGPAGERPQEGRLVIAAESGEATFGIVADEVTEIARVGTDGIKPPPASLVGAGGTRNLAVRGVTEGLVVVLDLESLADDPRFEVNDEPI